MPDAAKALIACGGTGGHFYPGYVLGRALKDRGWQVLFLLRTDDPAAAVLAAEDLPFVQAPMRGMPRRLSLDLARFGLGLARGLRLAGNVVRDWRPSCVVGMGGYLTFPAVAAAWRRGIPSVLHESNAVLGLANRACLPMASKLALGLPLERPPASAVPFALTGTPVRPSLWSLPPADEARRALGLEPARPTLLVFGGSQGARRLNALIPAALAAAARGGPPPQCLHLTGPKEEAAVRQAYSLAGVRAVLRPYLEEMHLGYAAADLVVCRSGASTLAELAAVGKPALLVPYPSAAGGHQEVNARALERVGAAVCLPETGLTADALAARLTDLLPCGRGSAEGGAGAQARLLEMSRAYSRLQLPSPRESIDALAGAVTSVLK